MSGCVVGIFGTSAGSGLDRVEISLSGVPYGAPLDTRMVHSAPFVTVMFMYLHGYSLPPFFEASLAIIVSLAPASTLTEFISHPKGA
jgi:hypothetical protein